MEKELKEFFFTVANNPLIYSASYQSLLDMVDKYLEGLKKIPKTSKYYPYSGYVTEGLLVKTGRATIAPCALKDDYKRGVSYFTEKELNSFYLRRRTFIEILEEIASGAPLSEIGGIDTITIRASELQPTPFFEVDGSKIKAIEYPSGPDGIFSNIGDYKELNGIFQLAFLSLTLFLADGHADRIKRCARCNNFFPRSRNDKRNRFCSDDCRNLYNREQRKTDKSKAARADYMKKHRALLRERKRVDKLKNLMNEGHQESAFTI